MVAEVGHIMTASPRNSTRCRQHRFLACRHSSLIAYDSTADADPMRWSGTAFPHPRLLHFHTCGSGPPGEISWMILDPTVVIDGVALWEHGRLHPERFERSRQVLNQFPALKAAFAAPAGPVGL